MSKPHPKYALDTIHPDDRLAAEQAISRAFRSGIPQIITCRQRHPDGSFIASEFRADPGYRVQVAVEPMVQAPGEKWTVAPSLGETTDAVAAAKVIEHMHGAAFAFDAAGTFTYASPVAQTSIALTLEDLNRPLGGGAFLDGGDFGWKLGVHPDDYPMAAARLRECMRTGEPYNFDYRVLRSTGDYVWHRFTIRPTRKADGTITGWYGIGFDIDVYKRTEMALRESESALRQLIETLPAMIFCATPDGTPVFRSRTLRDYLGLDDSEAEGSKLDHTLFGIIHPDDLAGVRAAYAHSLASGEPYARRHRLRRHDGVYRWVETRAAPMRNAAGDIVQWNGVCLDIEERVRAEEELRLAQERLARAGQAASLAELSASIAHEVNQPLAAIVANAHAGQRWLGNDPPNIERARKSVERIARDAHVASDVVGRIRSLFRQSDQRREPVALGSLLEEARHLVAEEAARRNVTIDISVPDNLPPVPVDRVQIQQVLVNLMRNGMDAMDGRRDDRRLVIRVAELPEVLRVEVSDTGTGIAAPELMFEPFFTTKADGMGMGLAIARSIISAHGGQLQARNNTDGGATLAFSLPTNTKDSS